MWKERHPCHHVRLGPKLNYYPLPAFSHTHVSPAAKRVTVPSERAQVPTCASPVRAPAIYDPHYCHHLPTSLAACAPACLRSPLNTAANVILRKRAPDLSLLPQSLPSRIAQSESHRPHSGGEVSIFPISHHLPGSVTRFAVS